MSSRNAITNRPALRDAAILELVDRRGVAVIEVVPSRGPGNSGPAGFDLLVTTTDGRRIGVGVDAIELGSAAPAQLGSERLARLRETIGAGTATHAASLLFEHGASQGKGRPMLRHVAVSALAPSGSGP